MGWALIAVKALVFFLAIAAAGVGLLFAGGCKKCFPYLCSPLVFMAFAGLASLLSTYIPWSIWALLVEYVIVIGIVTLIRYFATGREPLLSRFRTQAACLRSEFFGATFTNRQMTSVGIGIIATFICVLLIMILAAKQPEYLIQNYDNAFHYSVIAHIIETGNASPIGAGSVMGSATAIYPDLWHALVALDMSFFGFGLQASVWVIVLLMIGLIAPLSLAVVVLQLFKEPKSYTIFLSCIGVVALPFSIFGFIGFGSLFPNILGLAMLPSAIALMGWSMNSGKLFSLSSVLSFIVCCLALGFAHPNTIFLLLVFLLPLVVCQCKSLVAKSATILVFICAWTGLAYTSLFARTVHNIDRTGDSEKYGTSVLSHFGVDAASFQQPGSLVPVLVFILIVGLTLFCAILLSRRWKASWYLVGLGIVFGCFILTFFPLNDFAIWATGYWYRDVYRLRIFTVFMLVPLLSFIPQFLMNLVEKGIKNPQSRRVMKAVIVVLTALCLIVVSLYSCRSYYRGMYYTLNVKGEQATDLTQQRADFYGEVAEIVDDDVVLNNAEDASIWLYSEFGVNALIKGRPANQMSSMSDDLCEIIDHIDEFGTNQKVTDAAKRLGISYVLVTDKSLGGFTMRFGAEGTIAYNITDSWKNISADNSHLIPVLEEGDMCLYRLEYQ